jgi:hypothetical protein
MIIIVQQFVPLHLISLSFSLVSMQVSHYSINTSLNLSSSSFKHPLLHLHGRIYPLFLNDNKSSLNSLAKCNNSSLPPSRSLLHLSSKFIRSGNDERKRAVRTLMRRLSTCLWSVMVVAGSSADAWCVARSY